MAFVVGRDALILLTTIITSILAIAFLIRSGFSGTRATSISEKVTVDRLPVLLLGADQRQTLLGFVLLPRQGSAVFVTRVLSLEVPFTPATLAAFEFFVIRLVSIGSARVSYLTICRASTCRSLVSLATLC